MSLRTTHPIAPPTIDWDERRFAAEGGHDRYGECRDRPDHYEPANRQSPQMARAA